MQENKYTKTLKDVIQIIAGTKDGIKFGYTNEYRYLIANMTIQVADCAIENQVRNIIRKLNIK